jgi:hypothetical protein
MEDVEAVPIVANEAKLVDQLERRRKRALG